MNFVKHKNMTDQRELLSYYIIVLILAYGKEKARDLVDEAREESEDGSETIKRIKNLYRNVVSKTRIIYTLISEYVGEDGERMEKYLLTVK